MTLRRGMTLLELHVGLTVGGTALASGAAVFATLMDRREALLADVDAESRSLAARRMLESSLAEARAGTAADDGLIGHTASLRTPDGATADDDLAWTTTANGDLRRMRLFIERSGERPALVVEAVQRDAQVSQIVLATDVAGLDVRYLTSAFGTREWRDAWAGGALLPGAVVVHLTPHTGAMLPSALQLPITVPLPNGR